MIAGLIERQSEIAHLCQRFGVRRLELFGSAAGDSFDPDKSDIDFLVEFIPQGWEGSFKRYMGLKLALEDLTGRSVDLIEIDAVTNPYFIAKASQSRRLVYAA